ncbi:MAG: hypothetical protein ACP5JT_02835 [Thermoplasmata archaeon]
MFNLLGGIGADKAIKIEKNTSMGHYNHKGKKDVEQLKNTIILDIKNGQRRRNTGKGGIKRKA